MGAFLDARQLSWTTNHGHSNGHDSGLSHRHRHGSLSSSSLPLASSLPSLSLLSTWSRSGEERGARYVASEASHMTSSLLLLLIIILFLIISNCLDLLLLKSD